MIDSQTPLIHLRGMLYPLANLVNLTDLAIAVRLWKNSFFVGCSCQFGYGDSARRELSF